MWKRLLKDNKECKKNCRDRQKIKSGDRTKCNISKRINGHFELKWWKGQRGDRCNKIANYKSAKSSKNYRNYVKGDATIEGRSINNVYHTISTRFDILTKVWMWSNKKKSLGNGLKSFRIEMDWDDRWQKDVFYPNQIELFQTCWKNKYVEENGRGKIGID